MNADSKDAAEQRGGQGAPLSEWVFAIVSALLVLGMVGFTLAEAYRQPTGPARISVQVDSVVEWDSGYLAMITLRNDGGETAASVELRGELSRGAERVEESGVTLDYVPLGGDRHASLYFRNDPADHQLQVQVVGFTPP